MARVEGRGAGGGSVPGPTKGGPGSDSLVFAAAAALFVGVLYYTLFRAGGTPLGDALATLRLAVSPATGGAPLVDPTGGTLPSFLHTLALTWLALALAGPARVRRAALVALVLGGAVLGELAVGTADGHDLVACLLGSAAALLLALPRGGVAAGASGARRGVRHGGGVLIALSFAFVTGTAPYESCEDTGDCGVSTPVGSSGGVRVAEPVYLGYDEFRGAVSIGAARPIASLGRLYVFGDRLFLNSRNEGVHVIDNRDPANPVNASFIAIPGNTELEIRDTYLYADSYIDLVTIDLGGSGYVEVDREENLFPYDEYQNVSDDIVFTNVDRERGVVIGHE